jgi:hypothetical protein
MAAGCTWCRWTGRGCVPAAIMLAAIMLAAIMPAAIMLAAIMLAAIMLAAIMLAAIMRVMHCTLQHGMPRPVPVQAVQLHGLALCDQP